MNEKVKVVSLVNKKQEQVSEVHDQIMSYIDELTSMMNENGEKATLMMSIIGTDDGYYHSVFVNPSQIFEAIGMLERFKSMLLDGTAYDDD